MEQVDVKRKVYVELCDEFDKYSQEFSTELGSCEDKVKPLIDEMMFKLKAYNQNLLDAKNQNIIDIPQKIEQMRDSLQKMLLIKKILGEFTQNISNLMQFDIVANYESAKESM